MLKVLLTSMGGLVAPNIINTLRKDYGGKIYIVGVDARPDVIGSKFVDEFFTVPSGDRKNYVPQIKEIIKNWKIDVVVPFADEEVLSLSKNREDLESLGAKILCNNYETTVKVGNKEKLLTSLSRNGFPTLKFFIPKSIGDIETYSAKLNYPKDPFVIKPTQGRGGRGFTIVTTRADFLKDRNRCKVKLETLIEVLKLSKSVPEILMMEYLEGEEYSVDVLAEKGKVIYAIPRKRVETTFGPSLRGEFCKNERIIQMCKEIVKIFKLHLISNIQFKCRRNDPSPYVTEVNPRPGGTIALNSKAGIPLLSYGIQMALGKPFPKNRDFKLPKFFRYYQEFYENV